jgi:hypothetical protein
MTNHHGQIADRLLFAAGLDGVSEEQREALLQSARIHADIESSEQAYLGNLIAAYALFKDEDLNDRWEHPLAELILRRSIRRRLGLFPELDPTGDAPNGGPGSTPPPANPLYPRTAHRPESADYGQE